MQGIKLSMHLPLNVNTGLEEKNDLIDELFFLIFLTEHDFMCRCQLTSFRLDLALPQRHNSSLGEEDILIKS